MVDVEFQGIHQCFIWRQGDTWIESRKLRPFSLSEGREPQPAPPCWQFQQGTGATRTEKSPYRAPDGG